MIIWYGDAKWCHRVQPVLSLFSALCVFFLSLPLSVSLTLLSQSFFTLFAIMFLTFFCRTATTSKKQRSRRGCLITHWHVSFCMIVPERQKQNTWKFLADLSASRCEMHRGAAPPISCLNRHEYFNCAQHFKLLHFLRNSVVYREMSRCHYVKWLAETSPS